MTSTPDNPEKYSEEDLVKWLESIPNGTIYAYNLDHKKTPGGLKVRWKIRIATGTEATRWEQKQAEAIKEILAWLTRHPSQQ
jgi:hypothetical protein